MGLDPLLDTVSTARGSGWVRRRPVFRSLRRTHPLPRAVLTVSKCDFLTGAKECNGRFD